MVVIVVVIVVWWWRWGMVRFLDWMVGLLDRRVVRRLGLSWIVVNRGYTQGWLGLVGLLGVLFGVVVMVMSVMGFGQQVRSLRWVGWSVMRQ